LTRRSPAWNSLEELVTGPGGLLSGGLITSIMNSEMKGFERTERFEQQASGDVQERNKTTASLMNNLRSHWFLVYVKMRTVLLDVESNLGFVDACSIGQMIEQA
jgi:hypothetical protein